MKNIIEQYKLPPLNKPNAKKPEELTHVKVDMNENMNDTETPKSCDVNSNETDQRL